MNAETIDRYRIESPLGEGGFGDVYRATHLVTGRRVALKVLRPEHVDSPQVLERFLLEARAAAAVGNQHIVEVLDAGRTDDGRAFLAMELLEGETLEARLDHEGPLRGDVALDVALQILDGLDAAHQAGIVHRDLKPANILLAGPVGTDTPRVKILDFGVSKFMPEAGSPSLTKTGMVLGTPRYMAPEQLFGANTVDARADLFSLSVLLYEMLSGKIPFPSSTYEELVIRLTTTPPISLTDAAPWLPAGLKHVVERGLSKDPDGRFASAAEHAAALKSLATASTLEVLRVGGAQATLERRPSPETRATPEPAASGGNGAPPAKGVGVAAPPSSERAAPSPAPFADASPARSRRRILGPVALALGALAAAALAAGVVFAFLSRGDGGAHVAAPPAPPVVPVMPTPTPTPGDEPGEPVGGSPLSEAESVTDSVARSGSHDQEMRAESGAAPALDTDSVAEPATPSGTDPDPAPASNRSIHVRFQPLTPTFPDEVGRNIARRARAQMGRCARPGRHEHTIQVQYGGTGALMGAAPHPPWNEDPVALCAASIFAEIGRDGAPAGGIIRFVVTIE